MTMQRDHHGVILEVLAPRVPVGALLLVGLVTLGNVWVATSLGPRHTPLLVLTLLLGALAVAVRIAPRSLNRVVVRVSTEELVLEVLRPLGARETTRVALRGVDQVDVVRPAQPGGWSVRLAVIGRGALHIPCGEHSDAEALAEHIRTAIAHAPDPLELPPQPPEALEKLRSHVSEGQ